MAETGSGVLKLTKNRAGELRSAENSFRQKPGDIHVPPEIIKQYHLQEGTLITGQVRDGKLTGINTLGGLAPDRYRERTPFTKLVAVDPCEKFDLAVSGNISMRMVDLIAPLGKGTRGMIVSPPKAGKTTLLMDIATAICAGSSGTRVIVFLIDERPEEVTFFRRGVDAEVIASSNDQSIEEHIKLAELTLKHIRSELECGLDVVVLVDSLTRMGRVFNLKGRGTGRTLSGGLDSGALEIPRKFFGLARNIENGGSVTIIATALVDTGSRMDELIFQEFKGTGNAEIVLDRKMAEKRIFPAVNIRESGTRREELLHTEEDTQKIALLRRALADLEPEQMTSLLLEKMGECPTNQELLDSIKV
jgi:transcription termination factor Rho